MQDRPGHRDRRHRVHSKARRRHDDARRATADEPHLEVGVALAGGHHGRSGVRRGAHRGRRVDLHHSRVGRRDREAHRIDRVLRGVRIRPHPHVGRHTIRQFRGQMVRSNVLHIHLGLHHRHRFAVRYVAHRRRLDAIQSDGIVRQHVECVARVLTLGDLHADGTERIGDQ